MFFSIEFTFYPKYLLKMRERKKLITAMVIQIQSIPFTLWLGNGLRFNYHGKIIIQKKRKFNSRCWTMCSRHNCQFYIAYSNHLSIEIYPNGLLWIPKMDVTKMTICDKPFCTIMQHSKLNVACFQFEYYGWDIFVWRNQQWSNYYLSLCFFF